MAQQSTGVASRTSTPPNNVFTKDEINAINDTVNANATDAENRLSTASTDISGIDSRLTAQEGISSGIQSYTTANLPPSVTNEGTLAFDTTLGTMVYYKAGEWYKVSDDTQVTTAPTAWTPAQLATAYWWDSTNGTNILDSSGSVSSWTDENQGLALTQGNATNQPITGSRTVNTLNVIDFQGDDYLTGTNLALTDYTKIVVVVRDATGQNNTISHASGDFDALWENGNGQVNVFQGSGDIITSTTPFTQGKTMLVSNTKASNGDAELFVFGISEGTANAALGTSTTNLEVGSFLSSNFLDGAIGDMILIPSVASVSDRQKAEGYLAHKWGFTADLDAGHPYKSSAPTI